MPKPHSDDWRLDHRPPVSSTGECDSCLAQPPRRELDTSPSRSGDVPVASRTCQECPAWRTRGITIYSIYLILVAPFLSSDLPISMLDPADEMRFFFVPLRTTSLSTPPFSVGCQYTAPLSARFGQPHHPRARSLPRLISLPRGRRLPAATPSLPAAFLLFPVAP